MADPFTKPTLENLPAEVRTMILYSVDDLSTLRCLVRASPTYHAQYMLNRDEILRTCTEAELDGLHIDAYAMIKSRPRPNHKRSIRKIARFVHSYRWLRDEPNPGSAIWSMKPKHLRRIAAFHLSVVLPLAGLYIRWTLANLERSAAARTAQIGRDDHERLSKNERVRILRALYRNETYHNLFRPSYNRARDDVFLADTVTDMFFVTILEAWEAEEVGCIDLFLRVSLGSPFDEVKAELRSGLSLGFNSVLRGRILESSGKRDDESEVNILRDRIYDAMTPGLETKAQILTAQDKEEQRVMTIAECLFKCNASDVSITRALSQKSQISRREMLSLGLFYDVGGKDVIQGIEFMSYDGDSKPPCGPPLAWVSLRRGTFANVFGEYVPGSWKEWGWVFWDESRLTRSGVRDLVAEQWGMTPGLAHESLLEDVVESLEASLKASLQPMFRQSPPLAIEIAVSLFRIVSTRHS